MYQFLFKNRLVALGFAALTLISVYMFVGSGENGGMPGVADGTEADQIEQQIAAIEAPPEPVMMDEAAFDEAYLTDEELVDTAMGIDPSPDMSDTSDFAEPAQPEVIDGIPVMQPGE